MATKRTFADNARKYWERGLNVIPLKQKEVRGEDGRVLMPEGPHGKAAFTPKWQEYSFKRQTEEELEYFINEFPENNIGVVCGVASGVVCLDIDSEELLDKLPRSPVTRKGKKGEGRFFKCPPGGLPSRTFELIKVDLLGERRQSAVPESIYPTLPGEAPLKYHWIQFEWDDLPVFPPNLLKDLEALEAAKRQTLTPGEVRDTGGRNNHLKSIACAMVGRGVTDLAEIAKELIKADKEKHASPLFSDKSEFSGTPEQNAMQFAASNMLSAVRGKIVPTFNVSDQKKYNPIFQAIELPEKPKLEAPIFRDGLLRDFYNFSEREARNKAPVLFMGVGLAAMAAACANRFEFSGIRSANYIMNIGGTGKGKSEANRIFNHFSNWDILGFETIESANALMLGWDGRESQLRVRVDLLDEFGNVLIMMARGGSNQLKILEALCRLRTAGNKRFGGAGYATKEKRIPPIWNMQHIVLASTTKSRLIETYKKEWTGAGFGTRFLMMLDETPRDPRLETDDEVEAVIDAGILEKVNLIKTVKPMYQDMETGEFIDMRNYPQGVPLNPSRYRIVPRQLRKGAGVNDLLNMYLVDKAHQQNESERLNPESLDSEFLSRHVEHAKGLAILYAVSEGLNETEAIEKRHMEQAIELVEWQYENSKDLFEDLHVSTDWQRHTKRVLRNVAARGIVTRKELIKNSHVKSRELDEVLMALWESGKIYPVEIKKDGPMRKGPRPIQYRLGPEPEGDYERNSDGYIVMAMD